LFTVTHLIPVGLNRRQLSDGTTLRAPARHVMTGTDIEVVSVIGIARGPRATRRLCCRHERRKGAPIDLPFFLRSPLPEQRALQKVFIELFLATAVDDAEMFPEMLVSLRADLAGLE
jgi:hypothetical protein